MKKTLTVFALLLGIAAFASAGGKAGKKDSWMTDAEAAMAKAKAENKILLMDFTGSDWCVWCHRLDGEVFSTETFKKYADENLVLLKLDFPRKTPQSDEEKKQNRALAEKYDVQGFPTVLVFNAEGEKIGQMGYQRGGPDAWLASLKKIAES
ncbi:MAG: thioredoxin family protein [Opitutaceae bacterium]